MEVELQGADIAKVAAMPKYFEDVLKLLGVTLTAKDKLKLPVIAMSM
jgi:3-dehydroquinate dehydratase-1